MFHLHDEPGNANSTSGHEKAGPWGPASMPRRRKAYEAFLPAALASLSQAFFSSPFMALHFSRAAL